MKFWDSINLDEALPLICDRSIIQIETDIEKTHKKLHESIIKKHSQRISWEEKTKLKNLIELRPPTQHQKNAILSLKFGGNCDKAIDLNVLKECQESPERWQKSTKKLDGLHLLDTLALLRTRLPVPPKKHIDDYTKAQLRKRAAAKYHTLQYLPALIKLNSPLKNSYCNTLTCSESIISKDGTLHSAYCKNRWCQVCNRIKTANLINGYQPELDKIENKQFVTITSQNVTAENLPAAIKHYNKWWRSFYLQKMDETKKIRRLLLVANKIGDEEAKEILKKEFDYLKIKGIKKIECTYNSNENSIWFDTYHPHAHILVNGLQNAIEMVASWEDYCIKNKLVIDKEAQKIKEVDSNICKELFKYFSKIASTTGKKTKQGKRESKIFIHALDIMFLAMRGLQVFTAFGINKIVDEDEVKPIYCDEGLDDVWNWLKNEWISKQSGKLTGYKPSKFEKSRKKYIVFDKKHQLLQQMPKKYVEKIDGYTYYINEKMQ
jgi:hypothetical protein